MKAFFKDPRSPFFFLEKGFSLPAFVTHLVTAQTFLKKGAHESARVFLEKVRALQLCHHQKKRPANDSLLLSFLVV